MKTLLIDAGNSHLKWAILGKSSTEGKNSSELTEQLSMSHQFELPIKVFESIVTENKDCDSVLIVSVLGETFSHAAEKITLKQGMTFVEVTSQKELANIHNGYEDPRKLGADRFVGIIAAYHLQNKHAKQKHACIIIDSGTATTIDAVDESGKHLGGVILSGLNLCSESLLENTKLLSLWGNEEQPYTPQCFSKETTQAIASGCLLGHAGAIERICAIMEQQINKQSSTTTNNKNLTNNHIIKVSKFICGGAAESLLPHMTDTYKLHKNLLMLGLKIIKEESTNNV